MTIIRNAAGDIIRRSSNLRGMIDHARRVAPVRAEFVRSCAAKLHPDEPAPTVLVVYYANGDAAVSRYAQADIAGRFLNSRRSWPRLAVSGDPAFVAAYASGCKLL